MDIENYLNDNNFKTRESLRIETGLSDRQLRNEINKLKKEKPVISNSRNSGYRLAKDIESITLLDTAKIELNQINLCIGEIEARKKDFNKTEQIYIKYKTELEKLIKNIEEKNLAKA